MSRMAVNKEELTKLREEEFTRQRFKEAKQTETKKEYVISYEKCGKIWYRMRQRKYEIGDARKQILESRSLRENVMKMTHDSFFG